MLTIPPPAAVAAVVVLAACVLAGCVAAWILFCRAERAADAPLEGRADDLAAAAEARAYIETMHAQHANFIASERSRWDAEPDTTELDTLTARAWPTNDELARRWSRAAASGWWLP